MCTKLYSQSSLYDQQSTLQSVFSLGEEAFMKFLATELGVQLMEKEVIKEVGDIPTREVLENKYINTPRYGQN